MAGSEILALAVGDALTGKWKDLNDPESVQYLKDTYDANTPGKVSMDLFIRGVNADAAEQHRQEIEEFFALASANKWGLSGTWVTLIKDFGAGIRIFDVTGGRLTGWKRQQGSNRMFYATMELETLDALRGETIDGEGATGLTDDNTEWLEPNVPGDMDALMRIEFTDTSLNDKIINALRFYRRSAETIELSDFTAWIDGVTATGASSVADTASLGGSFKRRTTAGPTTPVAIADYTPPTNEFNKGKFDIWVRARSNPEVLGAPTIAAVTKTDAVVASSSSETNQTATETPVIVSLGSDAENDVAEDTPTELQRVINTDHVDGSTVIAIVLGFDRRAMTITQTSGLTLTPLGQVPWTDVDDVERSGKMAVFVGQNLGAMNIVTGDMRFEVEHSINGVTVDFRLYMYEVRNAASFPLDQWFFNSEPVSPGAHEVSAEATSTPGNLAVAIGAGGIGVAGEWGTGGSSISFWSHSYTVMTSTVGFGLAHRIYAGEGDTPKARFNIDEPDDSWVIGIMTFRPDVTVSTVSENVTYQEPYPGEVPVGDHTFWVQAIDGAGHLGELSDPIEITTTVPHSAINFTLEAPSNGTPLAYRIYWEYSETGELKYFNTPNNSLTYTFTDPEGTARAAGGTFEAAQKSPNYIRFSYSSGGTSYEEGRWVVVPIREDGEFSWVLAGQYDLPATEALLDGTRSPWFGRVEGINGGAPDDDIDVDCIVTVPASEVTARVSFKSLALSTQGKWIIESHRTGKSIIGYIVDKTTGDVLETFSHSGPLLASPDDNIFGWFGAAEDGVADVTDLRGNVAVRLYPRYRW